MKDSWPQTQPEPTDGWLTLRPWRETDATFVFDACPDEMVQRWTRISTPYHLEDATGSVTRLAPHQWASGAGAAFAVVDDATLGVVGSIGLVRVDRTNHLAEVGYWMDATARGRGYASRALDLLSTWTLSEAQFARVEVENVASRKVATNARFIMEGVLRRAAWHRGASRDIALYARVN